MDISLWFLAGLLAGLILFACVVLILAAAWLVTTRVALVAIQTAGREDLYYWLPRGARAERHASTGDGPPKEPG